MSRSTSAARPNRPSSDEGPERGDRARRAGDVARADVAALLRFLAQIVVAPPDDATASLALEVLDLPRDAAASLGERYTHVFELNVYPYASVFLGEAGMLGGERRALVAGILRALGLSRTDPSPSDEDHLAVLLETVAALIDRELATSSPAERDRARHARGVLLVEHILPWMPVFTAAVERIDDPLYSAMCGLLRDVLLDACSDLELVSPAPHPMGAPPTGDGGVSPTGADASRTRRRVAPDGRQRLQALLSPARSGIYLSRHDVHQLGRTIGVPVRRGERAFMLQALLEAAGEEGRTQAPAALADMATAQQIRIDDWQEAGPGVASLWSAWSARLEETRRSLLELSAPR